MRRIVLAWRYVALTLVLSACNLSSQPGGTMAWIDAPVDGIEISPGQLVTLEGHAASEGELERIEFWVNGSLMVDQPAPESSGSLSHFEHIWIPDKPGDYIIDLIAYGRDGSISPPDTVTLHVTGLDRPSATPPPSPTPVPSQPTPTLVTPTLATSTPPPPAPTPTFTRHPPTLTKSPSPIPPDTTGPGAPSPQSPTGGILLGCVGSVSLQWSPASDPSGISQYNVELQRHSGDNNWGGASGSPFSGISGTSKSVSVECGWYYRWRVRAQDGAGNWGSFSSWATFAVSLT